MAPLPLPCTVLPCTEASDKDAPGLYSSQLVPSHRRELQTAVSTVADLTSALANTAVSRIVLASGTYYLTAELRITRSVILEAAAGATVMLNAQASSGTSSGTYLSERCVLSINPGSSGVVQLIGLIITGGYSLFVGGVYVTGGTVTISSCTISGNTAVLSGGGVSVEGGTVAISSCTISGNIAGNVRTHVQKFPLPDGKFTDVLAPTHACTTTNALVNYSRYVLQRPCKFSIAPMGDSCFACCLQAGGVYVRGSTVTITSSSIYGNTAVWVRAHLQEFLISPPLETHVLLLVCRVAVFV
jgi:hypothetical protein